MSTPPQSMPPQSAPPRHGFKKTLLTGLLTLLPIWLTWVVVKFVFVLLSDVSKPWVQPLSRRIAAGNPLLGWFADDWVQTTIAMIAPLLVILLVGWLARRVIGQRLLGWFEAVVARVTLARKISGSARTPLDILSHKASDVRRAEGREERCTN